MMPSIGQRQLEELFEEYNHVFLHIKSMVYTEQKPWPEFVAVFKAPQWDMKNIEQRLTSNVEYYRANYICICGVIVALQILFAPMVFLVVTLCIGVNGYVLLMRRKPIVIGTLELTEQMKKYGCAGVTFVIMVLSGVMVKLLWVMIYSALVCFLHMLFRPRSVSSKTEKVYEDLKSSSSSSFSSSGSWHDPESGGGYGSDASVRKRSGNPTSTPASTGNIYSTGPGKHD